MIPQSVLRFVGLLLFVLLLSGCHTPLVVKQVQAKNPLAKNAAKTPVKIVDVWNSYAQTTPDGKVMRGIAGRIHFYGDQKKNQAIKVDGDLTVFVFDGNETDPAYTKPIKVFQFKAETLDKHYSRQKPFGHGYNFFLPMDEIGGEEKSLCVMTRFDDGLDDMFVMATPVNTILAGYKPQLPPPEPTVREFLESRSLLAEANQNMIESFNSSTIQQVGYVSEKKKTELEKEKSRVSTIPLSSDMTRRLTETKTITTIQSSSNPEPLP